MKIEYLLSAIVGVLIFIFFVVWIAFLTDNLHARSCLNTGKATFNGTVYSCQKIGKEIEP